MSNLPDALAQLLDDLKAEASESSVVTIEGSYAKLSLDPDVEPIRLSREQAELVLNTPDTVELLYEALDFPIDAAIELHHIRISDKVQEALELNFKTVDEV